MLIGQLGPALLQLGLEALMPGAPLGLHVHQPVHARVVVFPHPALVEIHDLLDARHAGLHLDHLVHLLLVAADGEPRAAMVEDIGHLLGRRVLVERHRDRPHRLRRDHRPVERRAVAPDDRDIVAARHAQRQKAHRHVAHLGATCAQLQLCQMPNSFSR